MAPHFPIAWRAEKVNHRGRGEETCLHSVGPGREVRTLGIPQLFHTTTSDQSLGGVAPPLLNQFAFALPTLSYTDYCCLSSYVPLPPSREVKFVSASAETPRSSGIFRLLFVPQEATTLAEVGDGAPPITTTVAEELDETSPKEDPTRGVVDFTEQATSIGGLSQLLPPVQPPKTLTSNNAVQTSQVVPTTTVVMTTSIGCSPIPKQETTPTALSPPTAPNFEEKGVDPMTPPPVVTVTPQGKLAILPPVTCEGELPIAPGPPAPSAELQNQLSELKSCNTGLIQKLEEEKKKFAELQSKFKMEQKLNGQLKAALDQGGTSTSSSLLIQQPAALPRPPTTVVEDDDKRKSIKQQAADQLPASVLDATLAAESHTHMPPPPPNSGAVVVVEDDEEALLPDGAPILKTARRSVKEKQTGQKQSEALRDVSNGSQKVKKDRTAAPPLHQHSEPPKDEDRGKKADDCSSVLRPLPEPCLVCMMKVKPEESEKQKIKELKKRNVLHLTGQPKSVEEYSKVAVLVLAPPLVRSIKLFASLPFVRYACHRSWYEKVLAAGQLILPSEKAGDLYHEDQTNPHAFEKAHGWSLQRFLKTTEPESRQRLFAGKKFFVSDEVSPQIPGNDMKDVLLCSGGMLAQTASDANVFVAPMGGQKRWGGKTEGIMAGISEGRIQLVTDENVYEAILRQKLVWEKQDRTLSAQNEKSTGGKAKELLPSEPQSAPLPRPASETVTRSKRGRSNLALDRHSNL